MNTRAQSLPSPRLSVAMIVRDEQDVLASSIESVRAIADEIVLLDTGSVDGSVQIARQLGATVRHAPWTDDFASARNECLASCTGDWILWLDAGERLAEDSMDALAEFLCEGANRGEVYRLWVEVPPRQATESPERVLQVRLIPGGVPLRFTGRVRETLEPSIAAAGLSIGVAPGRLVGDVRQHDPQRRRRKAARDLLLAATEAGATDRWSPRLSLAAGQAHAILGKWEDAIAMFRQAIRSSAPGSPERLEAYYGLLTALESLPQAKDRPFECCLEALGEFPLDVQLLLAMGNHLLARGNMDLAVRSFDAAVRLGTITPEVWHVADIAELAATCLGLALQAVGRLDEACEVFEAARAVIPQGHRVPSHLLNLYAKQGRTDEALALVEQLPLADDAREPMNDAVRGACLAARQEWTAALGHLQAAYLAGCRGTFCLRWLAVTLISGGHLGAARTVLDDWQLLDPASPEIGAYREAIDSARPRQEPAADQQMRVDAAQPTPPAATLGKNIGVNPVDKSRGPH